MRLCHHAPPGPLRARSWVPRFGHEVARLGWPRLVLDVGSVVRVLVGSGFPSPTQATDALLLFGSHFFPQLHGVDLTIGLPLHEETAYTHNDVDGLQTRERLAEVVYVWQKDFDHVRLRMQLDVPATSCALLTPRTPAATAGTTPWQGLRALFAASHKLRKGNDYAIRQV